MIRFGCVPYLNAVPLIVGLDARLAPPRELAVLHHSGERDVSLLPVVELFDHPELTHVPGIAIASRGAADSVRLFLKVPLDQVRTVALDPHSRTTNALVRVLFERKYRRDVSFSDDGDAAVTIGDRTFGMSGESLDLGQEWFDLTGKPFVFAVWMHRRNHPQAAEIRRRLEEAKRAGLSRLSAIAAEEAPRRGLSIERARDYLTRKIRYDLGEEELEGMELFRQWRV